MTIPCTLRRWLLIVPPFAVQGATLITVCNLKPASMRGVKSFAMVLCVRVI